MDLHGLNHIGRRYETISCQRTKLRWHNQNSKTNRESRKRDRVGTIKTIMKPKYFLLIIFALAVQKGFCQYDTTGHQFHADPKWIFAHNNADADAKSFFINLSIPFQATPMYTDNSGSVSDENGNGSGSVYSHIDAPLSYFGLKAEPVWRVVNTDYFKLQLSGSISYSNSVVISALGGLADSTSSASTSVAELDYGYGGEFDAGSRFVKLLGMFQGGYRDVIYTSSSSYSGDGLNSSTNSTASASYNYWRAGAGLDLRLNSDGNPESFLKLIYYYEKPDYGIRTAGYGLELKSWLNVSFQYFPNYPIAGQPSYPVDNPGTKQAFWYFSLGKSISF